VESRQNIVSIFLFETNRRRFNKYRGLAAAGKESIEKNQQFKRQGRLGRSATLKDQRLGLVAEAKANAVAEVERPRPAS
jgi:hypothetical protein